MLTALIVAFGAAAQGLAGMGFGLLCAPFLIHLYGPVEGVRQVVLLSLILNLVFLTSEWREARGKDTLSLLVPSWLVTPLLALLFRQLSPQALLLTAGSLTVISTLVLALGLRLTRLRGLPGAAGAGVISAAMNVAGGLAGPAVAMYAVNARWPERQVRPTLQLYGVGLNVVTLLSLGLPTLRGLPLIGLVLGLIVGLLLAKVLPSARIRPLILALAVVGGVLVLIKGLAA